MTRRGAGVTIGVLVMVLVASVASAQQACLCQVGPTGRVSAFLGPDKLCEIELNAHGAGWTYVSQADAQVKRRPADEGPGAVIDGKLVVPNAGGGAVVFTQTITPNDGRLDLAYDMGFSQAMLLNGLQISLLLPAKRFAGMNVVITNAGQKQRLVLPAKLNPQQWQFPLGQGQEVRIAGTRPEMIVIDSEQPVDLLIQDLRQWQRDEFEIRVPLIQQQQGDKVSGNEQFHVKLSLMLAGPADVGLPKQ